MGSKYIAIYWLVVPQPQTDYNCYFFFLLWFLCISYFRPLPADQSVAGHVESVSSEPSGDGVLNGSRPLLHELGRPDVHKGILRHPYVCSEQTVQCAVHTGTRETAERYGLWCRWFSSTLGQVMAWCHQAPSHYVLQCWLIITSCDPVLWHSHDATPQLPEPILTYQKWYP